MKLKVERIGKITNKYYGTNERSVPSLLNKNSLEANIKSCLKLFVPLIQPSGALQMLDHNSYLKGTRLAKAILV